MLNVSQIRIRFISARLLASVPSIFKSAGCKGISFVAAHKLILNVSEPPWTAVVSSRSQFASANWQPKNEQGCSFLGVPAVNLCSRLVVSERTGMSVVSHNGDVFAPQKLAFRSVHGCTLLDRLFSKALDIAHLRCRYAEINAQRIRTPKDGRGYKQ